MAKQEEPPSQAANGSKLKHQVAKRRRFYPQKFGPYWACWSNNCSLRLPQAKKTPTRSPPSGPDSCRKDVRTWDQAFTIQMTKSCQLTPLLV